MSVCEMSDEQLTNSDYLPPDLFYKADWGFTEAVILR